MLMRIYCILFIMMLFLPTLQHSLNIFPDTTLMGVEEPPPRPEWTVTGWLNGTYQKQYTKRRNSRLGLRGYLVKTYNQLHYSLFHRLVSSSGTQVVIGEKNWLYEQVYLEKLHSPARDNGTRIEEQARWLRVLQDRLNEMGIAFVFVIAPSKAEVYPEYIPPEKKNPSLDDDVETDYQQAREALRRHGVRYVDSHALFMREKDEKGYHLFGPSGTHWNKYGAYLVWKEINRTVQDRLSPSLQIPELKGIEKLPSEEVDADLGNLLNLWDSALSSPMTDYPVFQQQNDTSPKPGILIVGDSFLFTLVDIIKRANLSTDVDAWYYFKRHFHYPARDDRLMELTAARETPMAKGSIDWQDQFFGKDLVILVETQQWLPDVGFGFVEGALQAIEQEKSDSREP